MSKRVTNYQLACDELLNKYIICKHNDDVSDLSYYSSCKKCGLRKRICSMRDYTFPAQEFTTQSTLQAFLYKKA